MSFFISFNGQFKSYTPSNFFNKVKVNQLKKSQKVSRLNAKDENSHLKEISLKFKHSICSYDKEQTIKSRQKSIYAKDLMSTPVFYHHETDIFHDIYKSFEKYHYKHFPILDINNNLVGIVSDRDLLKCTQKDSIVKNFMSKEVLTVKSNARIQEIAKVMLSESLSSLPVINDEHLIIGIITKSDILRYIVQSFSLKVFA